MNSIEPRETTDAHSQQQIQLQQETPQQQRDRCMIGQRKPSSYPLQFLQYQKTPYQRQYQQQHGQRKQQPQQYQQQPQQQPSRQQQQILMGEQQRQAQDIQKKYDEELQKHLQMQEQIDKQKIQLFRLERQHKQQQRQLEQYEIYYGRQFGPGSFDPGKTEDCIETVRKPFHYCWQNMTEILIILASITILIFVIVVVRNYIRLRIGW